MAGALTKPSLRVLVPIAAIVLLLVALGINFYKLFTYRSVTVVEPSPNRKPKPFEGTIKLTVKGYDPSRQMLTAELALSVQAIDKNGEIADIAFSSNKNSVTDKREYKYFQEGGPSFNRFERQSGGILVDAVEVIDTINVPLTIKRQPILYPFDRYAIGLRVRSCVNSAGYACINKDNLFIKNLEVDYSSLSLEPGFNISSSVSQDGELGLTLERNAFLRLASVLLFAIALVFFAYLVIGFKRDDLFKGALGYFGALWALRSLIVPKAITVFPTMVDYVILIIFCVLFVSVLFKYIAGVGETT